MTMANVLHRNRSDGVIEVLPSAPDYVPASLLPPDSDDGSPTPWPTRAKVAVAGLAVATLVTTIGAVIGFGTGDDGATQREFQDQIELLVVDRDEALATVSVLGADIAALRGDLLDARSGNDVLNGHVSELEAELDALTDRFAESVADADEATAALDAALADADEANAALDAASVRADDLNGALEIEKDRVAAAVAARDSLAGMFPLKFSGSLTDVRVVGKYSVKPTQVYCSGLASCGTAAARSDVAIRRSAEGFLRLDGVGLVDAGLFQAAGALHAVAGSTTAIPACNGSLRAASITVTMFPSRFDIAVGGSHTISTITAVTTVQAPAMGSCPAVLATHSAELTPKS